MLLARQGYKVLMIDQTEFPSDVRLSTHLLWHAGADLLHKWGLLDAVRDSNCPPLTDLSLDLGETVLHGHPPGTQVGAAFAPKRIVLDQILLNAAVAAGVEFRQKVSFEGTLKDGARVVGIRAKNADGSNWTALARVVVGADGRTSRVARAVQSPTCNETSKEQGTHNTYSYFSGVAVKGVEFFSRSERMAYAWQTNDGQVVVGILQPGREGKVSRDDVPTHFFEQLDAMAPDLAARVRAGQREEDWITGAIPSFCRKPVGPGWALVGDAGLTMDPITAAGITVALRDAESLTQALHEGLSGQRRMDEALAGFEARRDAVSLPLHQFAQQMAQLAPPTQEVMQLFGALAGNQVETDRYFGVFAQTVSPADFFDPAHLQKLLTA